MPDAGTSNAVETRRSLAQIEQRLEEMGATSNAADRSSALASVQELLSLGEEILEHWIVARGEAPTRETKEGFRLLALHRQGARGEPSFNACRETCRELVYHYNLVTQEPDHADSPKRIRLAVMVARHLALFVSGKMEVEGLGEFCCASKPIRSAPAI